MTDADWMRQAIAEAAKGVGKTAPNPPVGAVIVHNGVRIGSGWHRAAGQPHAEREALADAIHRHGPDALKGSTIFVTLEPCSSHGRTPPCTQGLIDAGVARVVYACVDRNPAHAGRADAILAAAGITVESGVLAGEAATMLRPFFKARETGLPWVIWKTAMTLDGRLTRPPAEGQWITGIEARADVQHLRSTVDAILTSGETVRRDRPALTLREPSLLAGRQQPWRVVFSDHPETLPQDAPLFTGSDRHRTLLRPRSNPQDTLRALVSEQGVLSVMTEAGGVFCAALFEAGLVDEVVVYLAPLLTGGGQPALAGDGFPHAVKLVDPEFTRLGQDIRCRARIA
jgi:diaminohydroxyphosphoribosylaminopyrimidine deaminase/5-amino-6-(5-phosphoribosylamino)uracil reductase